MRSKWEGSVCVCVSERDRSPVIHLPPPTTKPTFPPTHTHTHTHTYIERATKLLQGLCYTGKRIPLLNPAHLFSILRLRNKWAATVSTKDPFTPAVIFWAPWGPSHSEMSAACRFVVGVCGRPVPGRWPLSALPGHYRPCKEAISPLLVRFLLNVHLPVFIRWKHLYDQTLSTSDEWWQHVVFASFLIFSLF